MWTGNGLASYNAADPALLTLQTQTTARRRAMAELYGDALCGKH